MRWLKKLNAVSVLYQGEKFEGNGCRKLIKSTHILPQKEIMGAEVHPTIVQSYIAVFQALDKIKPPCFGSHPFKREYSKFIETFHKDLSRSWYLLNSVSAFHHCTFDTMSNEP